MPSQPKLQVSKLDAARRQLETAVRLYFSEGDPVSIHTLTAAAHALLTDLNQARGGSALIKESILQTVKPEKRKEFCGLLNAAANFFKHADNDPDGTFLLSTSQTQLFLFDACVKYKELADEIVPVLGVYQAWFWLGPGAELADVGTDKIIDRVRASYPGATRAAFFREVLPMMATLDK